MAEEKESQATWVAINASTYPAVLKINAQFHVDDDEVDTWVDARDDQGRCHMMTESQLARMYVREGELPAPEPVVEAPPAPVSEPAPEPVVEEVEVIVEVVLEDEEPAVVEAEPVTEAAVEAELEAPEEDAAEEEPKAE